MSGIDDLKGKYESLEFTVDIKGEDTIDSGCLLAFDYEYPEQPANVMIETDEFTAVCPWTGLPDFGRLEVTYIPDRKCVELKSLKYYLLAFRDVGILQEHAAGRMLHDLVDLCQPRYMKVTLDYKIRGGIHTIVSVEYPSSDTPQGAHLRSS